MNQNSENAQDGQYFNDEHEKLVRRYKAHKQRSQEFVDYLYTYFYERGPDANLKETQLREYVPRVEDCGSYLLFRDYYLKGDVRLVSANFCMKHLLCGLCAVRRAAKGAENLHRKAEKVINDHRGLKVYFIVLTVKNEPDLGYAYRKLIKGKDRVLYTIRDAKRARRTDNPNQSKYAGALNSEFSDVVGGVYSIEVTYNQEEKTWHPHMNLLLLSESEMDNRRVSKEWQRKTGDSYITYCKEKDPINDKGVVCEIMKYAMKFSELPFKQNIEAYLALSGKRLKGTIGAFRGVDLDPDPADDTLEGEPYIEILYSYYKGEYFKTGRHRCGIESMDRTPDFVRSDLIL